jgi:hypothetical protein
MTNDEKQELLARLDELEERIDIQILTLQVIRSHFNELMVRIGHIKDDLV